MQNPGTQVCKKPDGAELQNSRSHCKAQAVIAKVTMTIKAVESGGIAMYHFIVYLKTIDNGDAYIVACMYVCKYMYVCLCACGNSDMNHE